MNTFSLSIKGTLEYDTVVCGGGFAGAAAAWASASNGAKTLLIESSGELSVFPFGQDQNATRADVNKKNDNIFLPHTLISDGVFIESEAKKAGKDIKWVRKELERRNIPSIQDVFLMQTDDSGKTKTVAKEKKQ